MLTYTKKYGKININIKENNINNIDIIIIKLLLYKEIYNKYISFINNKNINKYIEIIKQLHVQTTGDVTFHDFKATMLLQDEKQQDWLNVVEQTEVSPTIADNVVKQYVTKEWANDLAIAAINLSEGRGTIEEVVSHYDTYASLLENTNCNELFVTSDFEKLWEKNRRDGGITWRLPFLNKYIGGLRKGDFGFVFARTNIGKTSFIASEISHMIKQVESPVLWINNEEGGERIYFRVAEAYFGVDRDKLGENLKKAETRFKNETKDLLKIYDGATISKWDVERVVKALQPSLIIIDNLDKLYGFKGDRHDLILGKTYQWARELAKQYAPVIGVCQAGATADGKKWLQLNDVADAHVAKQKEADFIVGIGASNEIGAEDIRYIHIVKNKFDSTCDKFTCIFDKKTSRYKEMV